MLYFWLLVGALHRGPGYGFRPGRICVSTACLSFCRPCVYLQLFLLYCNEGRAQKVVLGLTDTMYKKRLSTAGNVDTLAKGGFRKMMEQAPGLLDGLTINVDYVFMQNLGFTDPKRPKYELTFDQFLDALAAVAVARYPGVDPESAVREALTRHIRPLFAAKFGEEAPTGADGSQEGPDEDGGTVITTRTSGTGSKTRSVRKSRVVLTADGIAAAASVTGGPRVGVVVDQTTTTELLSGATVVNPGMSSGNSVIAGGAGAAPSVVKRRLTMKLGSGGGAAGSGGSVVGGSGGSVVSGTGRGRSASAGPPVRGGVGLGSDPAASAAPLSPAAYSMAAALRMGPSAGASADDEAGAAAATSSMGPARNAVPSIFSVNPFSPEARGAPPGTDAFQADPRPGGSAGAGAGAGARPPSPASGGSGAGSPRGRSPATSPVHRGLPGPASPGGLGLGSGAVSAEAANEMRGMIKQLLGVVEQLRGEAVRLRAENLQLRATVDILKAGGTAPPAMPAPPAGMPGRPGIAGSPPPARYAI